MTVPDKSFHYYLSCRFAKLQMISPNSLSRFQVNYFSGVM